MSVAMDIVETAIRYISSKIRTTTSCGSTDDRATMTVTVVDTKGNKSDYQLSTCNGLLSCTLSPGKYVCTGTFTSPVDGYISSIYIYWRVGNNSINAMEMSVVGLENNNTYAISMGNTYKISVEISF